MAKLYLNTSKKLSNALILEVNFTIPLTLALWAKNGAVLNVSALRQVEN